MYGDMALVAITTASKHKINRIGVTEELGLLLGYGYGSGPSHGMHTGQTPRRGVNACTLLCCTRIRLDGVQPSMISCR